MAKGKAKSNKKTDRELHVEQYKKELKNLKERIRRWEKRYGYKINTDELKESLKISFESPKTITQKTIQKIKDVNVKVFRQFGYDPLIETPLPISDEPVDIADKVISELLNLVENYTGESYVSKEGKISNREQWDYYFDSRKREIIRLIENGISLYGKKQFAQRAELLQQAYELATQYMDESKGEINQTYIKELGQLLFGRNFSMVEYARFEIMNEYNGNYA